MTEPTDAMLEAFVLEHFLRHGQLRPGTSWGHLLRCPQRHVKAGSLQEDPSTSCGNGTCQIEPWVAATITCPHKAIQPVTSRWGAPVAGYRYGAPYSYRHVVEYPRVADLIDVLADFASGRSTP